ncbi:MAG: hypothetical protein JWR26_4534 [Pedosphaera sp.]|nr:hypothetical protein [Pedosphaera sp.]
MDDVNENPKMDALKVIPPVFPFPPLPERPVPDWPFTSWLKKFFACNPFYLLSAASLLYGVYLVSSDTRFFSREIYQLAFNFGSLQFYELLLVATAIVLARRRIWYDSVLLVGLENMLVLVPFILISQAALLGSQIVWFICLTSGAAVLLRFWGLKRFFADLNLPRRMLGCGVPLLLVNIALPLIYRHLNDSKIGTKPTDGAAYMTDRYCWLLLLPALFALINLLPRPKQTGNLLPQRRWLPMGLFGLWLMASAVHLFCLSYVFNFDWEFLFVAPLLWVLMWSVYLRHGDFVNRPAPWLPNMLLAMPALMTLFAATRGGNGVFIVLTALDFVFYGILFGKDRNNRAAFGLMLVSIAALVAGFMKSFEPRLPAEINAGNWMMLFLAGCVMWRVIRSCHPKFGVLGALITAMVAIKLVADAELRMQLMIQLSLVFLLLHGLCWEDQKHHGARVLRLLACGLWVFHSLFLVHGGGLYGKSIIAGAGVLLLGVCLLLRVRRGHWKPMETPLAALVVLLAQPGNFIVIQFFATPAGVQAIVGSLLLFGLGTLAALTKSRWNPPSVNDSAVTKTTE